MKHMGLFEGIGGFSLAARWAGWETPVMVEWSAYCQSVLKKNFPDATIFGDIHRFDGRPYAGQIDVITGGFPCQPFSHAGKRNGADDDRYLWPEMLRVIREVAPEWVIGENVAGLISMDSGRVFDAILSDLENAGYCAEAYIIPAIAVGAPHRRDRVWIVAHRDDIERNGGRGSRGRGSEFADENRSAKNANNGRGQKPGIFYADIHPKPNSGITTNSEQQQGGERRQPAMQRGWPEKAEQIRMENFNTADAAGAGWKKNRISPYGNRENRTCFTGHWREHWHEVATRICRMDDGFPDGVDGVESIPPKKGRAARLSALGNAIVPQIAFQIFQAINQYK